MLYKTKNSFYLRLTKEAHVKCNTLKMLSGVEIRNQKLTGNRSRRKKNTKQNWGFGLGEREGGAVSVKSWENENCDCLVNSNAY